MNRGAKRVAAEVTRRTRGQVRRQGPPALLTSAATVHGPFGSRVGARATTYARNNLSAVLLRQGRLPEAATLARQNLDATREAFGAESSQTAGALSSLGVILARQGLRDEGEARQREAVALEERVHGSNHVDVGRALTALASLERGSGRFREAEAHARRAVDILGQVASQHPDHADALSEWADALIALDRFPEAEAPLSAALKIRTQTFRESHPSINSLKSALVKVRQFAPPPASPTNTIRTPP